MKILKKIGLGFFLVSSLFVSVVAFAATPITDLQPTVLLVSLDGFRHDYLDRHHPPTLESIAQTGVRAEGLIPVFPSLTFPNHYTIVTGLYPEKHGIVSNTMKDPLIPGIFSLGNSAVMDDPRWWLGEPIWVTAENQGQKAGTMFWPGSNVPITGKLPTYMRKFDAKVPMQERVSQVLQWLDLPVADRPTFLTLYYEHVDSAGHHCGPSSPEVRQAILDVDLSLGELMNGLRARGIDEKIHIVLVSDHGMMDVSPQKTHALSDYIDINDVEVVGTGATAGIYPQPKNEAQVYQALKKMPHVQVYRRSEIPSRYQYQNSERIPPILCVAEGGGYIMKTPRSASQATHGYDNLLPAMAGLFVARGPMFKSGGVRVPAFGNVHLYSLMAHVLSLKPAANDGSLKTMLPVLK